jgi:hypothetical protein
VDLGVDLTVAINNPAVTTVTSGGIDAPVENGVVTALTGTPGATALLVGRDTDGVVQALGLAPKLHGVEHAAFALDAETTAATMFVTQFGATATDPNIAMVLAGFAAGLEEFDLVVASIEASDGPLTDPAVSGALLTLFEAASRATGVPDVQGFRSTDPTDFKGEECYNAPAPENANVRVTFSNSPFLCLDIAEIEMLPDGTAKLRLVGRNQLPRWGVLVDHSDNHRPIGFVTPHTFAFPGILDAFVDLGQAILRSAAGLGCKVWNFLAKPFPDADCDFQKTVADVVSSYDVDGNFSIERIIGPGQHDIALYFGYPYETIAETSFDGVDYQAPVSALLLAQVFTTLSSIIVPMIGFGSDTRSGLKTFSDDGTSPEEVDELFRQWNSLHATERFAEFMTPERLRLLSAGGSSDEVSQMALDFVEFLIGSFVAGKAETLLGLVLSDDIVEEIFNTRLEDLLIKKSLGPILGVGDIGLASMELFLNMWNLTKIDDFSGDVGIELNRINVEPLVAPTTTMPPTTTTPPPTTTTTTTIPPVVPPPNEIAVQPPTPLVLPAEYEEEIEQCESWDEEWVYNGSLAPCTFGPRVAEIQRALIAWGVGEGMEADGYFGPSTQRALLAWQWRHGWPDRTTWLSKYDSLWPQVAASLSDPNLPRNTPCPVWRRVDEARKTELLRGNRLRPVFGLCDEQVGHVSMEWIQVRLTELGYPTTATGRLDMETRGSLLRYTEDAFGSPRGDVDVDLFWHLLGDWTESDGR